ncbi:DUF6387 family protein [Pseudomonas sp. AN-1]|uniref:DUF6387 family protein n=1 Tax=Pseudomonas sp. AN-1 TaxID=3096605 RepID=UPI002A6A7039|nr:DUF6387 family protein [Pseudomonas sp. AN-1]WPP47266.1 DUF6387 family protein [Pseudomonas sp. AN-1]
MAKIDRVEDLPGWFKQEHYSGCKSFRAVDWHGELSRRKSLWEFYETYPDMQFGTFSETVRWLTIGIQEEPIIARRTADVGVVAPIQSVTAGELMFQRCFDRANGSDAALFWDAIEFRHTKEISKVLGKPLFLSCDRRHECPKPVIQIDLEATDSVLRDAFDSWLKRTRDEQGGAAKRECPAYKNWASYGLLPYLDLRIWTMETGNQIPLHVMAQAVGYCKGGDSFRKTVQKLAYELMSSLAELKALAAIEAASEKPVA